MATVIKQNPLYPRLPVGQEMIFSLSNTTIVATQLKTKFVAYVHISDNFPPNVSNTTHLVGAFKTTPNNAGVGMFDFRPLLESYVSPDSLSTYAFSEYKTNDAGPNPFPIHLIDKYARSKKVIRYVAIKFFIEHLDSDETSSTYNEIIEVDEAVSDLYEVFDGYVKDSDILKRNFSYDFGFDMSDFQFQVGGSSEKFLTNAPTTQYANKEDYGTLAFLTKDRDQTTDPLEHILFTYKNSAGATLSTEIVDRTFLNGAYTSSAGGWSRISQAILYFGCFPGNLRNWSSTFNLHLNDIAYYTIKPLDNAYAAIGQTYRININCPDLRGYESVRLCWLNQWGVWDYYTFTKKSVRMLSTKGSTYEQLGGTWNESLYKPYGYKGGKKAFRVNATEKITMNTDFVNESESEWFEELINSPEVYILKGYTTEPDASATLTPLLQNDYVTPVRLTTSSFTRKTIANDKLMQYTFEVEKSKTLRTQSV